MAYNLYPPQRLMYGEIILRIMDVYNMRLPKTAIKELNTIAQAAYIPPRTLIRMWIMQRLEAERMNIEPVPGVVTPMSAPGTDDHQTQGAGAGVNID